MSTFRIVDNQAWIGDRLIPWAQVHSKNVTAGPVRHYTRQILVRLECGIEFSIVWGSGTYSSNRYFGMEDILKKPKQDFIEESPTAEVAVWDNKDRWLGDSPYGWVTPEQVLAAIDALMVPGVLDIGTARAALERGEING